MKRVLGLLILSIGLTACTHSVHLVNFSEDLPVAKKKNAQFLEVKTSQFVVLGFSADTNYVNEAYQQLMTGCPQGNLGSIATKYYTSHGFFSWTNYIIMDGYCYN